jgi:hypothetical protein
MPPSAGKIKNSIKWFKHMSDYLSDLKESAVQIAWEYLDRSGEIEDASFASRFLTNSVHQMIEAGERSRPEGVKRGVGRLAISGERTGR